MPNTSIERLKHRDTRTNIPTREMDDFVADDEPDRHAHFTGADQPCEKLERALRAEIDEAVWSTLYSTKSYPVDPPKSGKIAVKVINHSGDEVLKVSR